MNKTILSATTTSTNERVAARLRIDGDEIELYFACRDAPLDDGINAFLIASLLPAMRVGVPLIVEGPVSQELLDSLPEVQAIFSSWDPLLREIDIHADAAAPTEERRRGSAAFFSLGVDSFFTLNKKSDVLTHLVFVRGFDLQKLDDHLWEQITSNARRVAEQAGLALLEVETNLKALERPGVSWRWLHGPVLAAVAHTLTSAFGTIYISASQTGAPLVPWGTHPLIDPLWSTGALRFIHFGSVSRVRKLVEIAHDPLVLETLRVCLASDGREYNCGRCEKCFVMMLVLEAMGLLARSETFPHDIDVGLIARLNLKPFARPKYSREALELLRAADADDTLIRALEQKLRRTRLELMLPDLKTLRERWRN